MKPPFELPELPYAYDALSPHMSERTLILHHDKHHRSYVAKLNELIAGTHYENLPLEEIIRKSHVSKSEQNIFNNAGQHWNHSKLWLSMKPNGGGHMPPALERRLAADFGSVKAFKTAFLSKGLGLFGSGWVFLTEVKGCLQIMVASNARTPIVDSLKTLLVCDVWEHAYYVDHENRRREYLELFLDQLVDWDAVAEGRIDTSTQLATIAGAPVL